MGRIVAIGGGEISNGENERINIYIVKMSKKMKPNLLFIPTASHDAEGYIKEIEKRFGNLGCSVSSLCLYDKEYSKDEIEKIIMSSDIIYVGGGDTVSMMKKWKECRVDEVLKMAYEKGIVLSGLSAGSICWFDFGHSDSSSFSNKDGCWDYERAYGLGLIHAAHCPHYNEEGRKGFDEMMKNENMCGIALENGTAFVEDGGRHFIIKENSDFHGYRILWKDGTEEKTELLEDEDIIL